MNEVQLDSTLPSPVDSTVSKQSSNSKTQSKSSKQTSEEEAFYKDMEYPELVDKIFKIRELPAAKKILRVVSAQKRYNLPSPKDCKSKKYKRLKYYLLW